MFLDRLLIPNQDTFLDDLVLQRTDDFNALGGGPYLDQWFATGEKTQLSSALKNASLVSTFITKVCKQVSAEVDVLLDKTKITTADHFVSIGPGNGFFELIIFEKIRYKKILLIDIEQSTIHQHGFHLEGSGYASLQSTKEFMVMNGVPAEAIITCNPRRDPLPSLPFNLLISLLSMGFHYPCDEYANFILGNIKAGAYVVFDKRKEAADRGYELLATHLKIDQKIISEKSEQLFTTTAR